MPLGRVAGLRVEEGDGLRGRHQFVKQLQSFENYVGAEDVDTSHIATRPVQTIHISANYRVKAGSENNRDGFGSCFGSNSWWPTKCSYRGDPPLNKIVGEIGQPFLLEVSPPILNSQVTSLNIPHLSETSLSRCKSPPSRLLSPDFEDTHDR